MPTTWKHPTLGEFAEDDNGWSRTVTVPAFKAFSYDIGYSNAGRSTGKVGLALRTFTGDRPAAPSPEMVALLEKVMAEPRGLVNKVTAALWEEFNGRGPESGLWWHGDMKMINQSFKSANLPPPLGPEDLLPALQLTNVVVFNHWWDHPAPIVDLDFHAAFEEEHGVSVLTNVDEILGTGFSAGDAMLWKHLRSSKPPRNPFA